MTTTGSGVPLVCLPGLTRNAADFDDLAAALGGRHRLIRLTLRGRGASDRDPDPTNYSVETESGDVIAFLDHLGLDRVVIVGTSRGGIIAMVLAAVAKDRLAGVLPSGSCRSRSWAAAEDDRLRGHLKWARRSRQKAISSSVASAPGFSSTKAQGVSPQVSSGRATTAAFERPRVGGRARSRPRSRRCSRRPR
jgi:pimeloyl-ACP methyl ester carboxylesterase